MMSILTIVLFFVYCWGFGYSLTFFLKNSEDFFERNLMRIGIGLMVFSVVGVILNLLHIPIDWKFMLVLSCAAPLFMLIKNKAYKKIKLSIPKVELYLILLLLIFSFTLFMYLKGAFAYPWLEDDDPWNHAASVEYISMEKTAYEPSYFPNFNYIDAYPPAYDIILAVLHQTSPYLSWTLKFFNGLIISLSIIFFYYAILKFTKSKKRAIFSTFVLAMLPSYLSHFIWAHSLIPLTFFVILYCLEMMQEHDNKWIYPSIIGVAALIITQPTQPVKIGVMLTIYFIIKSFISKRFLNKVFLAGLIGFLLAMAIWWGPMLIKYKSDFMTVGLGQTEEARETGVDYIGPLGSATRLYTFDDFFIAKSQNMINNPVGIGIAVCILLFISLLILLPRIKHYFNQEKCWVLIALLWLLFTFAGLYGGTVLPIALESFQFWMLFAVCTSIIVSGGFLFLIQSAKKIGIHQIIMALVLIIAIFLTSGYQKYQVNTVQWPPGGWLGPTPGSLINLLYLKEATPINTKVFIYDPLSFFSFGVDKFSCEWCEDTVKFRSEMANYSAEQKYSWLKSKGYEYVLFDGYYYSQDKGVNATQRELESLLSTNKFIIVSNPEYQGQKTPSFLLKVL